MKKLFSLLLGACTVLAACTDDVENIRQDGSAQLAVNVKVNPTSRAMLHGTALPGGSSIGINVTDATGNPYDGKDAGYLNVQYTATGEAAAQTWAPATDAVLLSGTEGKMHAYYPWTTGIDYTTVAVDVADQIDWMYAADAYTVSDAKNAHEIVLSHAQTAINVNLVRDASYTGVGAVETLTVTSEGLASTASLDTRDGSFASVTGANTAISIIEAPYTLDGSTLSSQENPYMFIPASTETKDFTVSATLDGKSYSHKVTMAEAFAPGKVYKINVTFKNTGLEVSTVTLVDWVETGLDDAEFKPVVAPVLSWETLTNGVYAVAAGGSPVMADDADETCIAVALITDNQRIMIEKNGKNNRISGESIYNIVGTNYVYFGQYSWSDISENVEQIPDVVNNPEVLSQIEDYVNDFNGKFYTSILQEITMVDSYNNYPTIGLYCKHFNQTTEENQGYNDWYIPAAGQLNEIYLNRETIKNVISNIGGLIIDFDNYMYWSSSEWSNSNGIFVTERNGVNGIGNGSGKKGGYRVRFVRDIN